MTEGIVAKSPYDMIKIKFQRKYPGYIYRREIIDGSDCGVDDSLEIVCCYSSDTGDYMGNAKMARFLCKKNGLRLVQKAAAEHRVCSIGFNEKEQKWFGWSHCAIYGFGIGSVCKKGDCGYRPYDKDDFLDDTIRFWSQENHGDIKGIHDSQKNEQGVMEHGVYVDWKYNDETSNKKMVGSVDGVFAPYPDEFGRGEWEAKTMKDAKQMAIDFAKGVS